MASQIFMGAPLRGSCVCEWLKWNGQSFLFPSHHHCIILFIERDTRTWMEASVWSSMINLYDDDEAGFISQKPYKQSWRRTRAICVPVCPSVCLFVQAQAVYVIHILEGWGGVASIINDDIINTHNNLSLLSVGSIIFIKLQPFIHCVCASEYHYNNIIIIIIMIILLYYNNNFK